VAVIVLVFIGSGAPMIFCNFNDDEEGNVGKDDIHIFL
jgi:hypothetical protein